MLVGLSGYLANYTGSFSFESGSTYPDEVDVYTMRIFGAAWGAMLVPLAYVYPFSASQAFGTKETERFRSSGGCGYLVLECH
ncbi:hypothetical protein G6F68_018757 [Rhizopus microsporus]|nr:hypothetical protein G6F68_018757 [Rhizopus microsporus]